MNCDDKSRFELSPEAHCGLVSSSVTLEGLRLCGYCRPASGHTVRGETGRVSAAIKNPELANLCLVLPAIQGYMGKWP